MDSPIWLPESAVKEQVAQRERHTARVVSMLQTQAQMDEWNHVLKGIDERLELVKAHESAKAQGLRPGYWHVMRNNPGGPPSLLVVEGPDGEYREPDSALFDQLRSWDNWDSRARGDRERRMQRVEEAARKRKAEEREARLDEALGRFKALENPGIRFGGSWTAKAGARKPK